MAKNPITVLEEGNKALDELNGKLLITEKNILKITDAFIKADNKSFYNAKIPNDVNQSLQQNKQFTEQVVAAKKEQERVERALITQIERNKIAQESTNKALIKARVEGQQNNRLIKEAAVLSSRYSSILQKTTILRNREAKIIQDLNIKRSLGNKLTKEETRLLRQSETQFKKYDNAIRKAKEGVGRFQDSVGNYQKGVNGILSLTRSLVGAFGIVEGIRLGVDFAQDAVRLAREAKGVEFAFQRLGVVGQEAFDNIKRSTRGLLSDLDIKKSIVEFDNFNLSAKELDKVLEFVAVRSTQTGKSFEYLRDSAIEAISKESVRRADNLGLSQKELNDKIKEGATFLEAFTDIAQREVAEAGDILDEAANSQQRFNAAFENFKVSAGSGFIGNLTNDIYDLGAALISTFSDLNDASEGFGSFLKNLARVSNPITGGIQRQLIAVEAEMQRELKKRVPLVDEIIEQQRARGISEQQLITNRKSLLQLNSKQLTNILKDTEATNENTQAKIRNVEFLNKQIEGLRERLNTEISLNNLDEGEKIRNQIKNLEKERDAILGNNKAKADAKELVEGSFEAFNKTLNVLQEQQKSLATNNEEWAIYEERIQAVKDAIEELQNGVDLEALFDAIENELSQNEFEEVGEELSKLFNNGISTGIESLADELGVPFQELYAEFNNLYEWDYQNFLTYSQKKIEQAELEEAKKLELLEKSVETALEFASEINNFTNALFDNKIQRYEDDINRNADYYATLLDNEELTEEQRSALEAERDRKEREIEKKKRAEQRKQAIFNKAFNAAEIIANTAVAISKALAQGGFVLGIPQAAVVGALGAIQLATVLAQPIPAYEKGKGEYDNYEGMAIWGEKKQEAKISKDGTIELSPKKPGNHLTHVKKDDIIHPDAQKFLSSYTDDEIYNNLHKVSILASMAHQSDTINSYLASLEQSNNKHSDKIVKALERKKMSFKVNQTINVGDDIAFALKKESRK